MDKSSSSSGGERGPDPPRQPPPEDAVDALNEWQLVLVGAATLAALIGLAIGSLMLLGVVMEGGRPGRDIFTGAYACPAGAVALVLLAALCTRNAGARRAAFKDGVPAFAMAAAGLLATTIVGMISG